jgi:hypothetical protein
MYCRNQNIFCPYNASQFWKGVILVAQAVKFGYRSVTGNGKKIQFWEDIWFGTSPLVTQFWDQYLL